MNRRDFLSDIALGFSAIVFTPKLIQTTWKRLPDQKVWVPHWAFFSGRWEHERRRQIFPDTYGKLPVQNLFVSKRDNPVFLREQFYEEMHPVLMAASGIIVEPFDHMPANWKPDV
jgi:hypothetical protein